MLSTLFLSVSNMSIIGSFVILAVLLVRLFLKKTPKIFSYALWAVVLFRLVCPFVLESELSILPSVDELSSIHFDSMLEDIDFQTPSDIKANLEMKKLNLESPVYMGHSAPPTLWVSIIWILGVFSMVIYSIIQFVKLNQKLVGATPLQDNIYLADHISSPFVLGFIKPRIYLPSSMTETEQSFIISHEQYHIKRFDHITRILGFIALAIHWFNPFAWLAFVLSGKDMEMSCDEAVMKKMDTDIRMEYSQSLLRFATSKKFIAVTPLAFGEGDTKDRVQNVMRYKKPMIGILITLTVLIAVLLIALSTKTEEKPNNLNNSIVVIQVNDTVFNPRYYENDFNFNYDELPVLTLNKDNQTLPLLLTNKFKKTAYLGFDAYKDSMVVGDTFELSVDNNNIAYINIGDETQQNTPYLHSKYDYIICYLKSDFQEKAEYVFKIELNGTVSDFKG